MSVTTRSSRMSTRAQRLALAVATTTVALSGAVMATGAASAAPTVAQGSVPYTPTITKTPGVGCFAVVTATKLPQTRSGSYRVKVDVKRSGLNCGDFYLAVNWKNTSTGGSGGQVQKVDARGDTTFPDNILEGFGFAPGAGKVDSTITTYSKYDEEGDVALPNIPGRANFTLS